MSLWRYRRRIEASIAGALDAGAEAALRRHLAACEACRGRYDRLCLLVPPAVRAARERQRLAGALAPSPVAPARPRAARGLVWLAPVVAVAALALWWRPWHRAPDPEVTYRGLTGPESSSSSPWVLALYESPKGGDGRPRGDVRLIAELPGSGEALASRRAFLQLGCRALEAPGHLAVVAVRDDGGTHFFFPPAGGRTDVAASPDEVQPLGPPVDLAGFAGRLRLVAVFSRQPLDLAALARDAAASAPIPGAVVGGILQVEP